ncbi:MAG: hypothetical protein R3F54_30675 [Alphaproteobacteria bacterium]
MVNLLRRAQVCRAGILTIAAAFQPVYSRADLYIGGFDFGGADQVLAALQA